MVQYGCRPSDSTKTGRLLEKSGRAYTGPPFTTFLRFFVRRRALFIKAFYYFVVLSMHRLMLL